MLPAEARILAPLSSLNRRGVAKKGEEEGNCKLAEQKI
jgi:hypothetical protein